MDLKAKIAGLRESISGLTSAKEATIVVEMVAMNENVAHDFIAEITDYPPETAGNRPPPPYYARGVGLVRSSGIVDPPSEHFDTSWSVNSRPSSHSANTTVSTPVTYAPWLVGSRTQAQFHEQHGWRTVEEVLRDIGVPGSEVTNTTVTEESSNSHIRNAANKIRSIFGKVFSR